jgi:sugar phosphate isomerase/epimerase
MLLDKVGLQLYSLRDETAKDFPGTVKKVAAMGYKAVEFAGYDGLKPSEMSALLSDLGLTAYGAHVGSEKLEKTLDQEIEMNLAVGNHYLVCPYAPIKTRDDALRLADFLNGCNKKIRAAGMSLGYHNHAHEFEVDGGEYLLDILFKNADPSIFAEVDVFWVAYAGVDPVQYISKYPNRQPLIHLKELAANGKDNVEIGKGKLDFSQIIKTAQGLGTARFIVEQEEYTLPPLESCKASLDALLKL